MATITKSTKLKNKTSNKMTFTFGENPELVSIVTQLEGIYSGMSKSEIVKLALIELLNISLSRYKIGSINNVDKQTIEKSIKSGTGSVLNSVEEIDEYFSKL
jgi:hypothetical protein